MGSVAAGVVFAPHAVASGAQTPTTLPPTSTSVPKSTAIDSGLAFTGATITSPSDPTPRSLDDYQTAVFMQSWLGEAVFGKPEFQDPPADLPVYRVEVSQLVQRGQQPQVVKSSVYIASDGTTAYISVPREATTAPPPPAPALGTWWIAPPRTLDAFNGKGTLVNTAAVQQANSPRTPVSPDNPSTSSSSTSWLTYALVIGAAVVLIGGGVMFFRRRRSSDRLAAAD